MAGAALTTPQRNTLLDALRAHPRLLEVRDARVAQRLHEVGMLQLVDPTPPVRRFQLTPAGLERATKLAARRMADHLGHVPSRGAAGPAAAMAVSAAAAPCTGQPPGWPFPVTAHCWAAQPARAE